MFIIFLLNILVNPLFSQGVLDEEFMVWVEFSDKNDIPYSLDKPHEFLTERAIERRQKSGVPIDFYDLPVNYEYVKTLADHVSGEVYYTSRWFNGAMIRVTGDFRVEQMDDFDFVTGVEVVKPLGVSDKKAAEQNDTLKKEQHRAGTQMKTVDVYGLDRNKFPIMNDYEHSYEFYLDETMEFIDLVNGQYLHNRGYNGEGVLIGVLDSGFRKVDQMAGFNHLWINNKVKGYKNFVEPGVSVFEAHTHGTYVLSVMAALLQDLYRGGAPEAEYWFMRTEDAGSEYVIEEYNWLAGIEFADSVGVDIINSSLGYTEFDDKDQNYVYSDLDGETTVAARAANIAYDKGILVVNSAGNYGNNQWQYIGTPADAHGTLSIGATNNIGDRVSFSSIGPSADGRIKPDIMAQGRSVPVVNLEDGVSGINGTSFASPLIASMSACLLQKFPDATNQDIRDAIVKSADRYFNPDTLFGYGIPDFKVASEILGKTYNDDSFVNLTVNPIGAESSLNFYIEYEDVVNIDIFNAAGNIVWQNSDIPVIQGFNELRPFRDLEYLVPGIYFIRLGFTNRTELIKALKI